jgi:hypothetical protein
MAAHNSRRERSGVVSGPRMFHRRARSASVAVLLGMVISAVPALAQGGNILPADAQVEGFTLAEAAKATAVFSVGPRTPESLAQNVSEQFRRTFQVLYTPNNGQSQNTFHVQQGRMFYMPLFSIDDSPPILGKFPDVRDHDQVVFYVFSPKQLGAVYLRVMVDGKVTNLGPDYVVGVKTKPLPDGGGTHYITAGVFLTALAPGRHTVKLHPRLTGAALGGGIFDVRITYNIIVH